MEMHLSGCIKPENGIGIEELINMPGPQDGGDNIIIFKQFCPTDCVSILCWKWRNETIIARLLHLVRN